MSDSLAEVPIDQWPSLRDLFIADYPRHFLAYSSIDNLIEFFNRPLNPAPNTKILCLNGDWSDGTFIFKNDAEKPIMFYTLEESQKRLRRIFQLYDWSRGVQIHPYDIRFQDTLNSVRVQELDLEIVFDTPTIGYWLPKKIARDFDIKLPEDTQFGPLDAEHCDVANSYWPHASEGSNLVLRTLATNNISFGLFGKEHNDLRAWVFRADNGVLKALHVHPAHQRKGYGSLLLRTISKAEAEQGRDTFGCIVLGNAPSFGTFNKCGFTSFGTFSWTETKSTNK